MTDSNTVELKTSGSGLKIVGISYITGTLDAPSGTSAPTVTKKSDTDWTITVNCDRDGKESRAKTFNDACGGFYHEFVAVSYGFDDQPSKLNFCFAVSITFGLTIDGKQVQGTSAVVWFGQGHAGVRNNWWMGGYQTVTNGATPLLTANGTAEMYLLNLGGGVSDFQISYRSKTKAFEPATWMSRLSGSTTISGMTIPGTHDSCSLHGGDAVRTQTQDLPGQLNNGVRFLDIRCRRVDNLFEIYHGMISQQINFGQVLTQCLDFLAANPSETIVMSMKEEYDVKNSTKTFEQIFNWYLQEFNCANRWYLGNTIPLLNDVRNKIVLFRRFPCDIAGTVLGLKAEPWEDDKTFTISNTITLTIEDQWKVPTMFDRPKKWEAAKANLNAAGGGAASTLYATFCSGTSSGCYPYTTANYVNPKLTEYMAGKTHGRFGCILMDFETYELNALVISTNL